MSENKVSFVKGSLLNNNNCIKHGSDAVMIDENDRGIYIGNNTNNPKMVATGPNSFKTINGESILGSGDIEVGGGKEPFYFEISDIDNLTNSCFDFSDLINAFKEERPIFLRFDATQSLVERYIVPVSMTYNEIYLVLSFIYYDSIYKIEYSIDDSAEVDNMYCSTEQTVTIIPINSIYSKPGAGIPKSDLSSDVQTILNNSLTENDIYDDSFIKANGIVDENDYYYHLPSDANSEPNFTLATKSDINASLTKPANYQIWYTTTDASVIEFDSTLFDNNQLLSNVYENGKGVITFDRDISSIPGDVFNRKNNLKTIIIPDSVTTIGVRAFYYCDRLTSVTIPDSVTTIGDEAFYYCFRLTSVTIPNGVTTIGNYTFWGCLGLTTVTIPDSVTTIGNYAFNKCSYLTNVTIPDSVTSIGEAAFAECNDLKSITIPDSVTTIGNGAFSGCYSLTSVYCKSTIPPGIYEDTTPFDTDTNLKIYVPIESLETYKNVEGWDVYYDKICSLLDSNSVKTINGESIIGSGDITIDTSNLATKTELAQKQDTLVSGTNIKTINNTSILGSGNIAINPTTPMRYSTPAANIPIPMNDVKVITSVTSTNQTFTLVTTRLVTNPASITQEQKWEIVFAINNSLTTAPTITFNTGSVGTIYWINGEAPTFEVGKFYEVSFLNAGGILLGVCAEFSPAS